MFKENLRQFSKELNVSAQKFYVVCILSVALISAPMQCSELAQEKAPLSLQEILAKKPAEMHQFIDTYNHINPRVIFGLAKHFTPEELESAYEQLKKQFDPEAMESNDDADMDDLLHMPYITDGLKAVHGILTIPAVSKRPQAQARNAARLESEKGLELTPLDFHKRATTALSSKQPWVGLGIPQDSSKVVISRTYKKLLAFYSPEQLARNTKPEWRSSTETKNIPHLLIQLRDAMLAPTAPVTTAPKKDVPPEPQEHASYVEAPSLTPSSLYQLAQNIGQNAPWVIFGIDENANAATIKKAFTLFAAKYNPLAIQDDAESSEDDKKIAQQLDQELVTLRNRMLENLPKKQAPAEVAEVIGTIQTTDLSPWLFFEEASRNLHEDKAHISLGIDQKANAATIEQAYEKLKAQFSSFKIEKSPKSTPHDKSVATRIGPLLVQLRDRMLKNLEESSK